MHHGSINWPNGIDPRGGKKCVTVELEMIQDNPVPHHYISTACQHGMHHLCREKCKFCGAKCECEECKHG